MENDSDFAVNIDKAVDLSEISQEFKADEMNNIGKLESLGKNYKVKLKELNYADIEGGDEPPAAKKNKFIEIQERKKQVDE